MLKFGERLKELRLKNKYTQKQIAERLGVAISAVSSYESGVRYPTYDSLIKLARIFRVSTDYLLGLESPQNTLDVSGLSDEEQKVISSMIKILRKNNRNT